MCYTLARGVSMNKCAWHSCVNITVLNTKNVYNKFCSSKCKNKYYVVKKRRDIKKRIVDYKGGQCESCGYIGHPAVYDLHHKDPLAKDFSISRFGHSRSWSRVKSEIEKCILLCANCHREEHAKNYI